LIDDGVDRHSGLARPAIPDDEFALASANGDHAVDRRQTSL